LTAAGTDGPTVPDGSFSDLQPEKFEVPRIVLTIFPRFQERFESIALPMDRNGV
jgi:hypothetical protein